MILRAEVAFSVYSSMLWREYINILSGGRGLIEGALFQCCSLPRQLMKGTCLWASLCQSYNRVALALKLNSEGADTHCRQHTYVPNHSCACTLVHTHAWTRTQETLPHPSCRMRDTGKICSQMVLNSLSVALWDYELAV